MSDTPDRATDEPEEVSGRDAPSESAPTDSGHSTADEQAERNQEDESPS